MVRLAKGSQGELSQPARLLMSLGMSVGRCQETRSPPENVRGVGKKRIFARRRPEHLRSERGELSGEQRSPFSGLAGREEGADGQQQKKATGDHFIFASLRPEKPGEEIH